MDADESFWTGPATASGGTGLTVDVRIATRRLLRTWGYLSWHRRGMGVAGIVNGAEDDDGYCREQQPAVFRAQGEMLEVDLATRMTVA